MGRMAINVNVIGCEIWERLHVIVNSDSLRDVFKIEAYRHLPVGNFESAGEAKQKKPGAVGAPGLSFAN